MLGIGGGRQEGWVGGRDIYVRRGEGRDGRARRREGWKGRGEGKMDE